jgi:xanthine dehydrogenase molybdenum-binding subunit
MPELSTVGKSHVRIDAAAKATGAAQYTADLSLPGMLRAKVLHSPHAHARIRHIDTSRAEALRGVRAVLTYKDVPATTYNSACEPPGDLLGAAHDQHVLEDTMRFIGDRVAVVAAVDDDTASEALSLIDVEYELLPAVFEPDQALADGAQLVHPDRGSNLLQLIPIEWGDVEQGFAEADHVFEQEYTSPPVHHCQIEPHAYVCQFDHNGRLTVWSCSQTPFHVRRMVSEILDIPVGSIRVLKLFEGGGFGGKQDLFEEPLVALLARKTGKPVMLEMSREEVFVATRTRHGCAYKLKTGVQNDGTITARQLEAVLDTGAYASHGPTVTAVLGLFWATLYKTPNLRFQGRCVYTNKPVAGAFRGYGSPQAHWCAESQMDEMAEAMGLDPFEFRLKSAYMAGDRAPLTEWIIESSGLAECMQQGKAAIGWERRQPAGSGTGRFRRGIGMARMLHGSGARPFVSELSAALIKMNEDGTVTVVTGSSDSGTGSSTSLAAIAAEVLGVGFDKVTVVEGDTDNTPFDMGSYASRTTYIAGNAVKRAAEIARTQLLAKAAAMVEANPEDLEIRDGVIQVTGSSGGKSITIAEVVSKTQYAAAGAEAISGSASHEPQGNAPTFAAHFAEVEVDVETGNVAVLNYVAAHDVGLAINPAQVEGQIQGGVTQGLGYALSEEVVVGADGRMANPNFVDYRIPTVLDVPNIRALIVEAPADSGPYGAKGVGETGLVPVAPAIANAVYNAIGVRIRDLPLTPQRVFEAIHGQATSGR